MTAYWQDDGEWFPAIVRNLGPQKDDGYLTGGEEIEKGVRFRRGMRTRRTRARRKWRRRGRSRARESSRKHQRPSSLQRRSPLLKGGANFGLEAVLIIKPIEDARQAVVKQLRYLPPFFFRSRLFLSFFFSPPFFFFLFFLFFLFSARVSQKTWNWNKGGNKYIFLGDDGSWGTYLTRSFAICGSRDLDNVQRPTGWRYLGCPSQQTWWSNTSLRYLDNCLATSGERYWHMLQHILNTFSGWIRWIMGKW